MIRGAGSMEADDWLQWLLMGRAVGVKEVISQQRQLGCTFNMKVKRKHVTS